MEPNDDPQLTRLLREWQVPGAPPSLDSRVLGRRRSAFRFLLTGQISVPVPLGLAVAAALIVMAVLLVRSHDAASAVPASTAFNLRDFQPLDAIQVRVIRSQYAVQ